MDIRAELVFCQSNNITQLEVLGVQVEDGGVWP
jgi:hypothetical protein